MYRHNSHSVAWWSIDGFYRARVVLSQITNSICEYYRVTSDLERESSYNLDEVFDILNRNRIVISH